jgi:CRISPR type III-associated protein (TIGR04423 family)
MSEKTIKSEQMDRRQLEQFWNELKSEGMDCGYYWLDNIDHPQLFEHENMPDFPGNSRNFIVESCWYKKGVKSVEIRFAGGKYIVTTVDLTKEKLEKPKEYFVATQEGNKILFSDIINEEDGSIKKIVFAGFGK